MAAHVAPTNHLLTFSLHPGKVRWLNATFQLQNIQLQHQVSQQRTQDSRSAFARIRCIYVDAVPGSQPTQDLKLPHWSLYDEPELYDRVFGERDFDEEVKFLMAAYAKHSTQGRAGQRPESFLELGCGPARHAVEAACQGVSSVTAVDDNLQMLEFARGRAAEAGAAVNFLHGRLEDLFGSRHALPEGFMPADLALLPLGTLAHALTNDDALRWLEAAGNALRPGGLLVLELAHPADVFDGALVEGDEWELDAESEGDSALKIVYGAPLDDFDPYTQILQRSVSVSIADASEEEGWQVLGSEVVPQRVFTLQEVYLLARLAGFSIEGLYGEMNLETDLQHEEAYRLIAVLHYNRM